MASEGSVYQRKDKRWVAQYEGLDGKQKYLYRASKPLAKKALREALNLRNEGKAPARKMTVSDLLDEVLEEMQVSLRTHLNRESFVRVHIKPGIGSHQLAKLNHKDVHRFYRDLSTNKGLAPSTIKRIHILLTQATTIAVRRKYISSNPMEEVKPPTVPRKKMKIFTAQEVNQLLSTARGDRYELAYVLGATLALRVGEALAMRWDAVDLEKKTITITDTLWHGETTSAKSESSIRTLELPSVAHQALSRRMNNKSNDGWLIPTSNGTPVDPANFWRWGWKPMLRKAGLDTGFTFHKLRHSAASFLLSEGVPLPVVSRYLGHAGPDVTARLYSHIVYGCEGMAAAGIDDALN